LPEARVGCPFLGRFGARGGAELDRQGFADRFGERDQAVAWRGLGVGPGTGCQSSLPGPGGPTMTAPEQAGASQEYDGDQAEHEENAGDRLGLHPGLGAEIGTRGDQTPRDAVVHAGPRRVARWANSSIRGTIGSASVVMVKAWMPELAHQRWKDA